jgi:anionic cell wall polymer biosynthesis LytR-Cps2A-Psr (LCP) family protein
MSTTDTVLLYIITICLTILTLFAIAIVVASLKLILTVQKLVEHAGDTIENIETAMKEYRDAKSRRMVFKLVRNIFNMYKKSKRSK